jgi:hypothetical protein
MILNPNWQGFGLELVGLFCDLPHYSLSCQVAQQCGVRPTKNRLGLANETGFPNPVILDLDIAAINLRLRVEYGSAM